MDITLIINAAILLIAALISAFVIPFIKKKMSAADLEELRTWSRIAVAAAEQLFTSLQGAEKLNYVLNALSNKGYDVDSDAIRNVVEAEVIKLHAELYGTEKVLDE